MVDDVLEFKPGWPSMPATACPIDVSRGAARFEGVIAR
jgi:hypothetical protein